MSSFQAIYDVNTPGNLFHASNYEHQHDIPNHFAGLPQPAEAANMPPPPFIPPTRLTQVANFFRPQSAPVPQIVPMKDNEVLETP
jgi:hypothetical protein